jgi:GNAT superfamily N-acetyltransferase
MTIAMRLVTDPQDPAMAAFGQIQAASFAHSDLLIPPSAFGRMIGRQTDTRRNFLLVAEEAGRVVGGTLFHYFAEPNTGFSSFLAVAQRERGSGIARRLHKARFAALDQVGGRPVEGVFIDVIAPDRVSEVEVALERSFGVDPTERRRIFDHLGFRRVDFAYEQPPDSLGGEPLTTMDLLYAPRIPASTVATERVVQTMRAYWAPWLGQRAADLHSEALRHRCGGPQVRLLSMDESG